MRPSIGDKMRVYIYNDQTRRSLDASGDAHCLTSSKKALP